MSVCQQLKSDQFWTSGGRPPLVRDNLGLKSENRLSIDAPEDTIRTAVPGFMSTSSERVGTTRKRRSEGKSGKGLWTWALADAKVEAHHTGCACHRGPGPVDIDIASDSHWRRFAHTQRDAALVVEALQRGEVPACVHVLPGAPPPPPRALRDYLKDAMQSGGEAADASLYEGELRRVPKPFRRFVSGGDRFCRFKDWRCATFFASLFHHIQAHSPTRVELQTWDLFHGHLFAHATPPKRPGGRVRCDLGILFHAREFPLEVRRNQLGKPYPIRSRHTGGEADVRIGTQCSIKDPDYFLRNYLWLLSTNQVVLLDTHRPELRGVIQNSEFHTVGSGNFAQLGDINYFPPKNYGSVQTPMSVRRADAGGSQDALRVSLASARGASTALMRLQRVRGHIDVMKSEPFERWLGRQVTSIVAHSRDAADHVFATPVESLMSPSLRVKATSDQDLLGLIRKMPPGHLARLEAIVAPGSLDRIDARVAARIPPSRHAAVRRGIAAARANHKIRRRQHNARELVKLSEALPNARPGRARRALQLTASARTGLHSAFRAENLLRAAIGSHRPANLCSKFGSQDFDLKKVSEYQRHVLLAAPTLRAMRLDAKERVGADKAARRISRITAQENKARWNALRRRRELVVRALEDVGLPERLIGIMYRYEIN